MKLNEEGRLVPDRVTLESFGEALVFVDRSLVVSAFDTGKRRVVLVVYAPDESASWKKARELEVPLPCPERASYSTSTSVELIAWGPKRARVFVRYTVWSVAGGARDVTTWAGELAFPAGALVAVENERPMARFDDTCVFHAKKGVRVVGGGRELHLEDPDADAESSFGETAALVDASSIWVTAPGSHGQKFAPRVHEFDRKTGKLRRTIGFGKDALPGLGHRAAFWNDGVLLSSGQEPQVAHVPRKAGAAPTMLTDANWASESYGTLSGQTAIAVVGESAFVGAPYGNDGAGALVRLHSPNAPSLEIARGKKDDGAGCTLASDGTRWLGVGSPYTRSGFVQLLRVEGERVEPAKIVRAPTQTKADAFEVAYPGFLASPLAPASSFAAWQRE